METFQMTNQDLIWVGFLTSKFTYNENKMFFMQHNSEN